MEKLAAFQKTIPEWYADEIENLVVPFGSRSYNFYIFRYLGFLKELVANLRFKHTVRYLQNVSKTKLEIPDYDTSNEQIYDEHRNKLKVLGEQLKKFASEYITEHNLFFSEENRNSSKLKESLAAVFSNLKEIIEHIYGIRYYLQQSAIFEHFKKEISQKLKFINVLEKNIQFDVENRNKLISTYEEIYSSRSKWNEMTDRNKAERPTRRIKFDPNKTKNVFESVYTQLNAILNQAEKEISDIDREAMRKDLTILFFLGEWYMEALDNVIRFLTSIFTMSGLKSTSKALNKLTSDLYKRSANRTGDHLKEYQEMGYFIPRAKRLINKWNVVASLFDSYNSTENWNSQFANAMENFLEIFSEFVSTVSETSYSSYFRRISLALAEDLIAVTA